MKKYITCLVFIWSSVFAFMTIDLLAKEGVSLVIRIATSIFIGSYITLNHIKFNRLEEKLKDKEE